MPSHQLLPSILTSIVVVAKWPEIAPGVGASEIKGLEPKWVGEYKTEGLFAENYVGGDNDDDVGYSKIKRKRATENRANENTTTLQHSQRRHTIVTACKFLNAALSDK